ncbi:hypothetical protein ML401_01680 [Bradyrhizobium sp. 62B]|uniref:hypothetical protein n=1 Tax=Bradyrhizobium sp. 62B TaxID=2898442 RepID=UPI0025580757|nr:hypothetical protein ML401_01680 [Bradyrhizobium sp. 62B]
MEPDNILRFPYPVHDLSPEEFASHLESLTADLEAELSSGGDGYCEHLERIEKASMLLKNICLLVSRGSDRKRAIETFERVMLSTAELRSNLRNARSQDPVL